MYWLPITRHVAMVTYHITRHVAILSVKETDFRVEKIPLKSVRPYIFSTIDLADSNIQPELEDEVMSHVSDEVGSLGVVVMVMKVWSQVRKLIARVPIDFPEANGKLPLIRLRVSLLDWTILCF